MWIGCFNGHLETIKPLLNKETSKINFNIFPILKYCQLKSNKNETFCIFLHTDLQFILDTCESLIKYQWYSGIKCARFPL